MMANYQNPKKPFLDGNGITRNWSLVPGLK